jgi:GT2 family glycosyltransferase
MILTLVICTYKRPEAIRSLLESVNSCLSKPQSTIIVDSSPDDETRKAVSGIDFKDLQIQYFKVDDEHRGLTKQRNYGISRLTDSTEIVAFLDDDIKVEPDYFGELIKTYKTQPDAIGVGGIDLNNNLYIKKESGLEFNKFSFYELNGWIVREPLRYRARKLLGLMSDLPPGLIPDFSNGRSALPPDGNIFQVEHFMGGIASYRKELLSQIKFSDFFQGYSLYEDFDFCVRALKYGNLYVNTNARVWHYHDPSGRPDFYKYGKMVVRNGWYVWRIRFPNPSFKAKMKWHAIALLLAHIRLANTVTGPDRKNAFMDYLGRMTAWADVCIKPPVIQNPQ